MSSSTFTRVQGIQPSRRACTASSVPTELSHWSLFETIVNGWTTPDSPDPNVRPLFETIVNDWTTPNSPDPNVPVHLTTKAAEAVNSISHLGGLAESAMVPSGKQNKKLGVGFSHSD